MPEIRVIDADGTQLGIIPAPQAVEKAREKGLDLVEVSPNAAPPVCRIMDFGKYKYEISKKQKVSKARQHVIKIKELKFHPKTSENDYNYRLVQAREFLEKGYKVKATVVFRGREMAHIEYGARWLKKMIEDLDGVGVAETNSTQEGRNVNMIFAPVKAAAKSKKSEKAQKPEKSGKPEKSEKSEKPGKPEKNEKTEKSGNAEEGAEKPAPITASSK